MEKDQVDNSIYETYGERWYTAYDDPIALLRAECKAKLPWILERINAKAKSQQRILDVGCGAGFLSNQLAKAGHDVTGVDLSASSLEVACRHDETARVKYLTADAYALPFADQSFDIVTAMDFLEHVEDPQKAIAEFARVLRPGGIFFFHTFNRNILAWLIIIKLVEVVVKNTPKHMHILRLFIKPAELEHYCHCSKLSVNEMVGLRPILRSITLKSILTGVVPQNFRFTTTPSLLLSYLGMATKEGL